MGPPAPTPDLGRDVFHLLSRVRRGEGSGDRQGAFWGVSGEGSK